MNFYKTINNIIFLVTVFIIVLTKTASSIETQWQGINEAQVKLVLPLTSTNNQKIVQVGLLYKLQDGWKTYWKARSAFYCLNNARNTAPGGCRR